MKRYSAEIQAALVGTGSMSEFWDRRGVKVPIIQATTRKPVFHESGYASGHAEETLNVPGLLDTIQGLYEAGNEDERGHVHYWSSEQYRGGWAWCRVQWQDRESLVFLHLVADGRKDVYHMSN